MPERCRPTQVRVIDELVKVLSSADAQASALALINDAGTYDAATGTGGFNGSLRLECGPLSNDCRAHPHVCRMLAPEKSLTYRTWP